MSEPKAIISPNIAKQVYDWILTREGAQIWENLEIGGSGVERLTPVKDADGNPNTQKPHWSCGGVKRVLKSLDEVEVYSQQEVARFRVGLKRGSGLQIVLTDAATRRVREACEKHRRYSCPCGWVGPKKDLRPQKPKTMSFTFEACPKCKNGVLTEGPPAWHEFDYETQEAVIYVETGTKPLKEFIEGVQSCASE